jgi:6-phosphofructokinase
VMGRHAGWIALQGGIAGGADIILIPEIPFDNEKIASVINSREAGRLLWHGGCRCRRRETETWRTSETRRGR